MSVQIIMEVVSKYVMTHRVASHVTAKLDTR